MDREKFEKLSLNDKRNELNKEIIYLLLFINKIVDDPNEDYFNFDINDTTMSEDVFLTEEYIQIIEAKEKLLSVFK